MDGSGHGWAEGPQPGERGGQRGGPGPGGGNGRLPPGDNDSVIMSEEAFGHLGNGGSLGFADPRARLSFGYAMNRLGGGIGLDPRGQALVDAVYQALGYERPTGGGMWSAAWPSAPG